MTLTLASFNNLSQHDTNCCLFLKSKYKAPSPATSLKQEASAKIAGQPAENASRIGIPNPSRSDANMKAKASL